MDRSLVQMERSLFRIACGAGSTKKTRTTPPRNGIVVALLHARNTRSDASGLGMRAFKQRRMTAVPMQLVCTRRTMPAADVTRNRPSPRPFANHAPNTHAPRSS